MGFVSRREVADLDAVLGELGQPKQTLFELFGLLRALVKLLELLPVVDLILEASLHDLLPHLFDTLDKEGFQFIAFRAHVDSLSHHSLLLFLLLVNDGLQVSDGVSVARLERLHVLDDLLLHVICGHARLKDQVNELLELHIPSRDVSVAAPRRPCRRSLTSPALLKDSLRHHL